MNPTSNKVKITYGSNNGRGHYYKGSKIKNTLLPSMPSLPEKNDNSKDNNNDIFDFNPDHDDFEARQLQRQRHRMTITTGKSLTTVRKPPTSSIVKNKSTTAVMDINSPVKIKKITGGLPSKKSANIRLNQKKAANNNNKKKKEKTEEVNKTVKGKETMKSSSSGELIDLDNYEKKIEMIDLLDEKKISKKRKLPEDENTIASSAALNPKNINKGEEEANISKHKRSNTIESTSSLTSLSSLPSLNSPPHSPLEVIEIPDSKNKTPTKTPSKTLSKTPSKILSRTPSKTLSRTPSKTLSRTPSKTLTNTPSKTLTKTSSKASLKNSSGKVSEEVIEIFSDNEKNTTSTTTKPKLTYKSKSNIITTAQSQIKIDPKNSNSLISIDDDDDDDDVIIIDDSKAKPVINRNNTNNRVLQMRKSLSVSDYNRLKRQKLNQIQSQTLSRSFSHTVQSTTSKVFPFSQTSTSIYNNKSFEISSSTLYDDIMFDLESNNYKMEELEDTFTLPTTPKIPRTITNSSIANDDTNDSSLSDTLSEDDDDHSKNFSTFPSISKSKSLSRLTDSRVGRMKSSQLKKSKSFGSIYDSGKSHSYSKDDSDISRITGSDGKEDEDGSGSQSPNSIKRGNSSLSYFNENDNKAENGKDKVINSEIKLLDGSSVNIPILFFKKKKKRLGHDGDVASLTSVDEGENKSNHFRKTYQNVGSLVKNDDPYEGPYVAMSKMFEDSEESEEEDLDPKNKNKKVKSMFELKELGENKKFKDEIDYLLDGLAEKQTTTTKRLSCIDLCKKLSESDFILNLRAYGYISQLYKFLSNEKDKIIQLCFIYFIYTLFQDEGSLDIIVQENNCIPLLIKFLKIKDDYISEEKLKNTKEKICMKEIRKVMEESEHFENTTISFQLISIKCLIQLLNPSSSVDVKNDLRQMLFFNNSSDNNKTLSSPTVSSSSSNLTCIDILINRLKTYTNLIEKDYQQWKSEVIAQKKNLPFPWNLEYLENINSCLKLFELLNKENELEIPFIMKTNISTYIIQLLHHFTIVIYNDHEDLEENSSHFLLNCIKVLINFFNEAKEAEQPIKSGISTATTTPVASPTSPSSLMLLTEENYSELFGTLTVLIDQLSPLIESNRQTKLQDIFLLIIGLLINATEHHEICRVLLSKQSLGQACSYESTANSNAKKSKWISCRFGCECPSNERKGFIERIVEIYSSIVKTENYILASYLAILIGFLCLHSENKKIVKDHLYDHSFSTIIQILEQFIQLNTLSQEFASPTLGFNPNALINAGGSSANTNTSTSMLDITGMSFPMMDQSDAGLDMGLINGIGGMPTSTSLSTTKKDRDTTTESFLKVIEILKQD